MVCLINISSHRTPVLENMVAPGTTRIRPTSGGQVGKGFRGGHAAFCALACPMRAKTVAVSSKVEPQRFILRFPRLQVRVAHIPLYFS